MKCVWEEVYVLSLNGAKFRTVCYKQFLDKRFGIQKNYWF